MTKLIMMKKVMQMIITSQELKGMIPQMGCTFILLIKIKSKKY